MKALLEMTIDAETPGLLDNFSGRRESSEVSVEFGARWDG
jgi:hypothetical protein